MRPNSSARPIPISLTPMRPKWSAFLTARPRMATKQYSSGRLIMPWPDLATHAVKTISATVNAMTGADHRTRGDGIGTRGISARACRISCPATIASTCSPPRLSPRCSHSLSGAWSRRIRGETTRWALSLRRRRFPRRRAQKIRPTRSGRYRPATLPAPWRPRMMCPFRVTPPQRTPSAAGQIQRRTRPPATRRRQPTPPPASRPRRPPTPRPQHRVCPSARVRVFRSRPPRYRS